MSTSAWIMFVVGAGIIWGGLLISLRKSKQNGSTKNNHKFIK